MTFSQWVNKEFDGSVKTAARHLGLLHRTVYSYYANERFPRPTQCQIILLKSQNQIDLQMWQQEFSNKHNNKTKKGVA